MTRKTPAIEQRQPENFVEIHPDDAARLRYVLAMENRLHVIPLTILPPPIQQILLYTPFPYQLYFPVSIYLGETTGDALWRGLAMQLFWVVSAFGFARWMWARGLKKYSAVGG